VPQNVRMPVPQIGLLEAFAIGIPVGIAGFAVQEAVTRRRRSRATAPREKPMQTHFGPREKPQIDAEETPPAILDVTPSPPIPVTKPSRTRPKRAGARPPQVAIATSPAKALAKASRKPAGAPAEANPVIPAVAIAAVAAPKATRKAAGAPSKAAPPKTAPAAEAAAAPKEAPAPATAAIPAAASEPASVKGPPKPLIKRQASLDSALDAVVDFVDGQPRKARAEVCAAALTSLVPRSTRGPALAAFLAATTSGTAPGELQALAETVGVELAGQLQVVRREISDYS
jgi:hypothetical protein